MFIWNCFQLMNDTVLRDLFFSVKVIIFFISFINLTLKLKTYLWWCYMHIWVFPFQMAWHVWSVCICIWDLRFAMLANGEGWFFNSSRKTKMTPDMAFESRSFWPFNNCILIFYGNWKYNHQISLTLHIWKVCGGKSNHKVNLGWQETKNAQVLSG